MSHSVILTSASASVLHEIVYHAEAYIAGTFHTKFNSESPKEIEKSPSETQKSAIIALLEKDWTNIKQLSALLNQSQYDIIWSHIPGGISAELEIALEHIFGEFIINLNDYQMIHICTMWPKVIGKSCTTMLLDANSRLDDDLIITEKVMSFVKTYRSQEFEPIMESTLAEIWKSNLSIRSKLLINDSYIKIYRSASLVV